MTDADADANANARAGAAGAAGADECEGEGEGAGRYSLIMDEIVDRAAPTGAPVPASAVGQYVGQVKWWNDKLGFGFATVCDGHESGRDIFVHHTGIRPARSNYRTLRKGEYVNFNITQGHNGQQAVDVTGICGGMLMCDVIACSRR